MVGLGRLDGCGGEGPSTCILDPGSPHLAVHLERVSAHRDSAFGMLDVHGRDRANPEDAAIEAVVIHEQVLDQVDGIHPTLILTAVMGRE